jgi:hypothetical protein
MRVYFSDIIKMWKIENKPCREIYEVFIMLKRGESNAEKT